MSPSMKLIIAGAVALFVSPANATLIVTTLNPPGGDNAISVSTCSGLTSGPATTITGCLQNSKTTRVEYDSTENIVFAAGGQAKADPATGFGLDNLKLSLIGFTFTQIGLNIEAENNGFVTFADNLGDPTVTLALSGNGDNKFIVSGGTFSFISFTTTDTVVDGVTDGDVNDVKQVRFFGENAVGCVGENCGPGGQNVPEPASIALLGAGLLGLGVLRRRRRRQHA